MDYLLGRGRRRRRSGTCSTCRSSTRSVERQRIWVIIVLLFFTAVFWTFFELAGSALNIFTRREREQGDRRA